MNTQILINILFSSCFYLLISFSFTLIYYPTKFFNFAHGAVITSSAYFVYFFVNRLSFPFLISVVLAVVSATIIGLLSEVLIYRHMRKRNITSLSYLIVSIGLYIILQNCFSLYFGEDTKIISPTEISIGHQIINAYISTIQLLTIVVSIVLFGGVNLFLYFSSTGKSIRAVASNSELSSIYGISTNKEILVAFGIGSAMAAMAGILSALDTNITPTFGFNLLLIGVVIMIIGGVGSTKGLIYGAFFVATTQHLTAYYLDTKWMDTFTYIILILFLIWKPFGFSGKSLKKLEV